MHLSFTKPRLRLLLRKASVLTFLAVLAPLCSAADLSPAETTQLLANLQENRTKSPSLTADFTEEKTSRLLEKPLVSQGTLAFQVPNKFRRELRGNNPSLMVSNGQKLWMYYPNFKEAELYNLGQRSFLDQAIEALTAGLNFQNVAEFYRYTATRESSGHKLLLTPKSSGLKRLLREITVWIDDEYRIQKTITVLPKGDQIVTSYRNQRPSPLPGSTFDYTPPAEARVSSPLGK